MLTIVLATVMLAASAHTQTYRVNGSAYADGDKNSAGTWLEGTVETYLCSGGGCSGTEVPTPSGNDVVYSEAWWEVGGDWTWDFCNGAINEGKCGGSRPWSEEYVSVHFDLSSEGYEFGQHCLEGRHYLLKDTTWHNGNASTVCVNIVNEIMEECHDMLMGYDPVMDMCTEFMGSDPILIATGKAQVYKLTDAINGVNFDLDGDGSLERTGWTKGGEEIAFLAFDRNNNGQIDNGTELIGDATHPGASNGFVALTRMMPINGPPGWLDADDPLYAKLLLWTDRNHNGISEPSELRPASDLLARIGLSYGEHNRRDGAGNQFRYRGWVRIKTATKKGGAEKGEHVQDRMRPIYDVIFVR